MELPLSFKEMVEIGVVFAVGAGAAGLAVPAMFAWRYRKDIVKAEKEKVAKTLHLQHDVPPMQPLGSVPVAREHPTPEDMDGLAK